MIRLFVALELPEAVRDRLGMLQGGVPGARWAHDDQLHLTLRFIGEVDEGTASDIDAALAQIRAPGFQLALAGVGQFGDAKPRALWAGVEKNPGLNHLRDKIEHALVRTGIEPDTRRYAPHVTLARLRNPDLPKLREFLALNALWRAEPFRVERFSLIASYLTKSGSIYEDQADYPLSG